MPPPRPSWLTHVEIARAETTTKPANCYRRRLVSESVVDCILERNAFVRMRSCSCGNSGGVAHGKCGGRLHLTVGLDWNSTHLGNEQNQEDRISDLFLRFEPLASIITLVLETSRVPYSRTIWPSRICVLRSWSRVIRGLIVTAILPTHDRGGCKRLVVLLDSYRPRGWLSDGRGAPMTSCAKSRHL